MSHRVLDAWVLLLAAWTILCNGVVLAGGGFSTLLRCSPLALGAGAALWWWTDRRTRQPGPASTPAEAPTPGWHHRALLVQGLLGAGLVLYGPFRPQFLGHWAALVAYFLLAWVLARRQHDPGHEEPHRGEGGLWLLALAAALFSLFVHRVSLDDALYVNFAVGALDDPAQALLRHDTLHERLDLPVMFSLYRMHSIELGAAALARLSGQPVLSVFHVLFPALFSALAAFAYGRLHRLWAPRTWWLATLGTLVLLAACGQGRQSFEIHFLRLAQGKSLVLVLFLPLTIVYGTRFLRQPCVARWLMLMAVQVAAAGCSANGAWVLPVAAGFTLLGALPAPLWSWRSLRLLALGALASAYVGGLLFVLLKSQPPRLLQDDGMATTVIDNTLSLHPDMLKNGQELVREAWRKMFGGQLRALAAWAALLLAGFCARTATARRLLSALALGLLLVFLDPFLAPLISFTLVGRPVYVRVLWTIPWPALAALVLTAPVRWWPGRRRATTVAFLVALAAYVAFVPSKHPFERDTVRLGFGGWNVPAEDLAAARLLTENTPPGLAALAPEGVGTWLVCLEGHPRPIVARRLYLQYLQRFLGPEEVRGRLALYDLVSGGRDPFRSTLLRNGIRRYQLGGVCLDGGALSRVPGRKEELRGILEEAGFRPVGEAGTYEVWCRDPEP